MNLPNTAVNLQNTESSPGATDPASHGDLVATVSHLAACLERAGAPDHGETVSRALAAARDAERRIAGHRQRISELERLAVTDELTGLLNRRGFEGALHHALAATGRYEDHGVLVYVDLDGFKPINDTYGHAAGDEVLRQVARILLENVRQTDYVGRLGGDEFAVLLTRTAWRDGLKRAEGLERVMNDNFVGWQGRLIALRASLGFQAYGPKDDGGDLLSRADDAMYKTKRLRAEMVGRGSGS